MLVHGVVLLFKNSNLYNTSGLRKNMVQNQIWLKGRASKIAYSRINDCRNYPALFKGHPPAKKNPLKILLALERISLNVKQMSLQDTQFIFYIYDAVLLSQNCVPKNGNKLFVSYSCFPHIFFTVGIHVYVKKELSALLKWSFMRARTFVVTF